MSSFRMSPRNRNEFDPNNSKSSDEEEIDEQEKNGSDEGKNMIFSENQVFNQGKKGKFFG